MRPGRAPCNRSGEPSHQSELLFWGKEKPPTQGVLHGFTVFFRWKRSKRVRVSVDWPVCSPLRMERWKSWYIEHQLAIPTAICWDGVETLLWQACSLYWCDQDDFTTWGDPLLFFFLVVVIWDVVSRFIEFQRCLGGLEFSFIGYHFPRVIEFVTNLWTCLPYHREGVRTTDTDEVKSEQPGLNHWTISVFVFESVPN